MAQSYYESFKKKLEEIFMMDHAELDFGIYRIMNQKRNDIQRFLDSELLPQVKQVLEGNNGGETDKAKKRMAEIAAYVGGNVEVLPKGTPMRDEYDKLEAQLAQSADTESMQADVFSHLVTFFSRYYDGGDFLSKRRYKDNTYAIPYNGEEVKLHWANSDQYYIKTSEYFRDYTSVLPTSRKKVHFVLKDASTEQNNNRAANNMERRFALWQPTSEEEPTTPLAIRRGAGGEAFHDFARVSFLVEVQHQSVQRLDGIGNRPVVILKLRAMRCPYRQTMLQFIVTFLYTCAHLREPGLSAKSLPFLLAGREARSAVPLADTCEFHSRDHLLFHNVSSFLVLK